MIANNWMVRLGIAVALSFSTPAAIAQTETVKLGASVQLSGALANTGRYYRNAYPRMNNISFLFSLLPASFDC